MSIGLTWAVGWGIVGTLLTAILRIFRPEDFDAGENELVAGALFAMAGFLCGSAFSLLFALAKRRRAVDDLSALRAAVWGGLGAGALPFLTTMTDSMAILFAPLGAAFAAGAVALAKRAARREALPERTR